MVDDLNKLHGELLPTALAGTPRAFFGCYDGHGGNSCSDYCREELHKVRTTWRTDDFLPCGAAQGSEPARGVPSATLIAPLTY